MVELCVGNHELFLASATDPSTGAPGSNLPSDLDGLFDSMFDELVAKYKDPMILLVMLILLLASSKDGDYQDDLTGLGGVTKWLKAHTDQTNWLLSNYNNTYFSADPQNATTWLQKLQNLFDETDNNAQASSLQSTLKNLFQGVLNTPSGDVADKNPTIGDLFFNKDGQYPMPKRNCRRLSKTLPKRPRAIRVFWIS